ncbi:hypothetical protein VPHD480_0102 [Vibrio phage D480]
MDKIISIISIKGLLRQPFLRYISSIETKRLFNTSSICFIL